MSHKDVYAPFTTEAKAMQAQTRGAGLVRDVHIYELKVVNTNMWMAIIEVFDLPMANDWGGGCMCVLR